MQAKKLIQKTVKQFVKSILDSNPDLLKKYVELGLSAVDMSLPPLNNIMKHLVVVQGLDPNAVPGERDRRTLEQQLHNSFNQIDARDYDKDYDFSWAHNRFQKTREALIGLNLTKDSFKSMTDLSHLESPIEEDMEDESVQESDFFHKNSDKINRIAPPSSRRTTLDLSEEEDDSSHEFEQWLKEHALLDKFLKGKSDISNHKEDVALNDLTEEDLMFFRTLARENNLAKKQPLKTATKKVIGKHVKPKK